MVEELEIPLWLTEAYEKPVAVFGGGVTGRSVVEWLRVLGVETVLYDEAGDVRDFDGGVSKGHRLVVASPGFPENHDWLKRARSGGLKIVTELDLGATYWRGPKIAITGTNGKTTLTEFLAFALRSAGIDACAVGNIGEPLCSALAKGKNPESFAICEISSFQASALSDFKADYVLWTNFDEDHLDRHGDLESYFKSKYRLVEQTVNPQSIIYGSDVGRFARDHGFCLAPEGEVLETKSADELGLIGSTLETEPELKTYLMARELWTRLGLSEDELTEAAHLFKKSPHRMELIRNIGGIAFWDDSKATNFHAVFGGLSRFSEPVIWIGGGKDKGGDVSRFAERIADDVAYACLIGETSELLARSLSSRGVACERFENMEAAVASAFANASSGQHILLSPGFSSFDMFSGYSERGEIYRKAVNALMDT